jgi:hypothetical protein
MKRRLSVPWRGCEFIDYAPALLHTSRRRKLGRPRAVTVRPIKNGGDRAELPLRLDSLQCEMGE